MKKTPLFFTFLFIGALLCGSFHEAAAQINRGIAVPPEKMPKTLSDISPKDYFIPSDQKKVGVVHALEGAVIVIHGTTREGYFAAEGDPIYEKDALTTLPESKCRIRFLDEDVVTMAPETEFSVESFEDQRAEGKKSSFFRMAKGKAMFYAMRLFRYRDTRFSLATPTNTIGVRGTKFGAHVYFLEESKTASSSILVADAANEIAPYFAQAGSGRSFTDCFSEDGVLNVDGQTVAPGQMYNGQTGQVIPTPPEVIRSFRQDAEIRPGGAATGPGQGTEEEQPPPPPPPAPSATAPAIADIQANITTVVQVQTGQQTEQQAKPTEIKSLAGPLYGYFSILLIKGASSAGPFSVYDAFLSSYDSGNSYRPSETDPNLNFTAYAVVNTGGGGDFLQVSGDNSPMPTTGTARLDGQTDSTDKINNTWTKTYVGQNSYTQWGYWQSNQPADFTHVNGNYYRLVLDRVWYLEGNHVTTAAEMPSGSYAYSGGAHGTYQGPTGGGYAHLSGSFNCQVNLGSGSVQDFKLNVADANGNNQVIINQGASVAISRNSNGNYFNFNGSPHSATINGNSATLQVNGSLYGPQAQEIGGNWGAVNSGTGEAAAGVFAGSKK